MATSRISKQTEAIAGYLWKTCDEESARSEEAYPDRMEVLPQPGQSHVLVMLGSFSGNSARTPGPGRYNGDKFFPPSFYAGRGARILQKRKFGEMQSIPTGHL
ncbi:MAG: hypothetical protein B6D68_02185 [spirochete symbiont of Stewartia floridana]|nr:MAG: hypothetical protein B6D68_02185 [spirochete symbiont of Stewartia floridana]